MKKTIAIILVTLILGIFSHNLHSINLSIDYNIIPQPKEIEYSYAQPYTLDYTSYISFPEVNPELEKCAVLLQEYIDQSCGLFIEAYPSDSSNPEERSIFLSIDKHITNGAFKLQINHNYISIVGGDYGSIICGIQYFRKLISQYSPYRDEDTQITLIESISDAIPVKASSNQAIDFPSADIYLVPNSMERIIILNNEYKDLDDDFIMKLLDVLSIHGINMFKSNLFISKKINDYASLLGIKLIPLDNTSTNIIESSQITITEIFNIIYTPLEIEFNSINNEQDFIYILPKLAAIEELQWSKQENIDIADFCKRLEMILPTYTLNKYSYSDDIFNIQNKIIIDGEKKNTTISLYTYDENPIMLSIDGDIMHYTEPIVLSKSCEISAITARKGLKAKEINFDFDINKATYSCVKCDSTLLSSNLNHNLQNLIDGLKACDKNSINQWVEFNSDKIEIKFDFSEINTINRLSINSLINNTISTNIEKINILTSEDDNNYYEIYYKNVNIPKVNEDNIALYSFKFKKHKTRYLKLILYPNKSYGCNRILMDEIIIN